MATKVITIDRMQNIEKDVASLNKWAFGENGDRELCASAQLLLIKDKIADINRLSWVILGAICTFVFGIILWVSTWLMPRLMTLIQP